MVGGPAIVFCRYHKRGKTRMIAHIYGRNGKKCKTNLGYDANALYLYCSGQLMPCGTEKHVKVKTPTSPYNIKGLTNKVLRNEIFGFAQVDIEVPETLYEKFSEMAPLFVVDEITKVPEPMKEYQKLTGRKENKNSRKLLGVMKAKKTLLYTPLLKWYIEHGLEVAAYHQLLLYQPGRSFDWFPEEVAGARREGDIEGLTEQLEKAHKVGDKKKMYTVLKELTNYPDIEVLVNENKELSEIITKLYTQYKGKKLLGDTYKLKGNSFYRKMIEDVVSHLSTTFTTDGNEVNIALRSSLFEDLEENGDAYEIQERKRKVEITRPYQCGIAVYQLAKLCMLEFYYDFLDNCVDRRDFEYIYMDTDSAYFAISGESLGDVAKPELLEEYGKEVGKWLATDKSSEKTPGLFKPKFISVKMIALTAKCYFCEGKQGTKYSCKGISEKQNDMTWKRYMQAFQGYLEKAENTGFRIHEQGVVTYEQNKLGLSAYYDKRYVLEDGIHTRPLF